VWYTPNLPQELIESGMPSDAQLEAVVYAGQAHSEILPDGQRRGFFIGDGTGVGKGLTIASIILDNFRQGRTRAVWVSKNADLLESARRDWKDAGQDPDEVVPLSKFASGGDINLERGILFVTYGTLKQPPRLESVVKWLGPDFDGVIVFDESHLMRNSLDEKTSMGTKKAAQR